MDILLASVAVFFAQLVRGVTGFGQSMVAIPPLVLLFGAQETLFIVAFANALAGVLLVPGAWAQMRMAVLLAVLLPLVAGQHVGTELLVTLPEETVRRVVGGVIGVFGLDVMLRPVRAGRGELSDLPPRPYPQLGAVGLAGLAGGVMGGLTGVDGPPIILALRHSFTDRFIRAQLIGIFGVSAITLSSLLWWKGAGDAESLRKVVLLLPALAAGALVGERLSGRLSPVGFGRLVGALLVGSGVTLLLR
ncbi:MAG: sulfite exporter TauE/SafE family protein [Alphaproteobacteria bacterium]|nr:sulfite exporter TauE/SafE family protein [Alphaproteobacteria bacterium]MCB9791235.1 sulfite exporter TauE/SafE family protein [Alphaproteobacteria bacterium]